MSGSGGVGRANDAVVVAGDDQPEDPVALAEREVSYADGRVAAMEKKLHKTMSEAKAAAALLAEAKQYAKHASKALADARRNRRDGTR